MLDLFEEEGKKASGPAAEAMAKALEHGRNVGEFSSYGGAPLLGVKGVTMIAHGRSKATAIVNALKRGSECARGKIVDQIAAEISRYPMTA